MEPDAAIEYLFRLRRFGMKEGFERAERLLEALGDPHEEVDGIQIGGTNGKGSTARMVESCLRRDGYDVGLYTSPHMVDLGERIRINGTKMTQSAMAEFVEEIRPLVDEMVADGDAPTFFETTTVMAFYEFARRDLDYAVLEVGLGGRYDITSLCNADAAAVTSVSLEHTDVLGDDTQEIAWEIGHIIPEDGFCSTGARGDPLGVIREMADDRDASLSVVDKDLGYEPGEIDRRLRQTLSLESSRRRLEDVSLPLAGEHQSRNAAVALGLLDRLGVSDDAVRQGLERADWPGRFEAVEYDPVVVLESAHNPAGAEAAVETLEEAKETLEYESLDVVFGVMSDKDLRRTVSEIAEAEPRRVYACEPSTSRSEDASVVAEVFDEAGVESQVHRDVREAVRQAVDSAGDDDAVLVTGSIFTVGEARTLWKTNTASRVFDSVEDADGVIRDISEARDAVHPSVLLRETTPNEERALRQTASDSDAEVSPSHSSVSSPSSGAQTRSQTYTDLRLTASVSEYDKITQDDRTLGYLRHRLSPALEDRGEDDSETKVMGILNVTPDSFYDGGRYAAREDAVERAYEIVKEGADIIDVGGESTRPGAEPVPPEEEADRVVPVIDEIDVDVPISVDTRHPEVARRAVEAGAEIVNDVTGLDDPGMRQVVAETGCRVVVMDSVNVPVDPGTKPEYDDVVYDVIDRLSEKVIQARRSGIDDEQIILDPGIGFGKGKEGDAEVLARTDEFASLGYPVLIGCSRKSFLRGVTDLPKEERLEASLAANVVASLRGADILRVHDVKETVRAVEVADALDTR
ncbi:dihydropteroate synthase [Halorutilales archaeon Cl-col2-1]